MYGIERVLAKNLNTHIRATKKKLQYGKIEEKERNSAKEALYISRYISV